MHTLGHLSCEACRVRAVEVRIESDEARSAIPAYALPAPIRRTNSFPSPAAVVSALPLSMDPGNTCSTTISMLKTARHLFRLRMSLNRPATRAPTFDQVRPDRERLIDFAMTQYMLRHDVVEALQAHGKDAIKQPLQQRVSTTHNRNIECRAYEICARVLGYRAGDWIRERWGYYRPRMLSSCWKPRPTVSPPRKDFSASLMH